MFSEAEHSLLHGAILPWFDRNRRLLPWRGDAPPYTSPSSSSSSSSSSSGPTTYKNAYGTWVSEIMCQQTRVETVIPYFINWMERWPTPASLASASEEAVQSAWAGLGFYRRARNLHLGAKKVVDSYGGVIPSTVAGLLDINGIGEYTAGAIASIAFGVRTPLVDGNVIRVISRLRVLGGLSKNCVASGAAVKDAKSPELAKTVWSIVRSNGFVSQDRPGDFNQALMELGATICTPRNPSCSACPLGGLAISGNVICKAFIEASEETTRGAVVEIEDLTIDSERLLKSPAVNSKDNAKKNNKNNLKSAKGDGKALTQTKLSFGSKEEGGALSLIVSPPLQSSASSAIGTYISDRFPPIHSKNPSPTQKVVSVVFETTIKDDGSQGGGGGKIEKRWLMIKREGGAAGGSATGLLAGQWQPFSFCNGASVVAPPRATSKKRKRNNEDDDGGVTAAVADVEEEEIEEEAATSSSSSNNHITLSISDIRALSPQLDKALGLFESNQVSLSGPTRTKHIFSHVIHDISVYTAKVDSSVDKSLLVKQLGVSDHRWATATEMQLLGLSSWALRILDSSDSFRGRTSLDAKAKTKKVAKEEKGKDKSSSTTLQEHDDDDGFEWMRLRLRG